MVHFVHSESQDNREARAFGLELVCLIAFDHVSRHEAGPGRSAWWPGKAGQEGIRGFLPGAARLESSPSAVAACPMASSSAASLTLTPLAICVRAPWSLEPQPSQALALLDT